MRRTREILVLSLLLAAPFGGLNTASAQTGGDLIGEPVDADQTSAPPAESGIAPPPAEGSTLVLPPPGPPPGPVAAPERVDGVRFRGGVGFTLGGEFFSKYSYSAMMAGIDGRFGVQFNDLIGAYFAAHLSFGGERGSGASGSTGTFAGIGMIDFTLFDTLFFGAGVGYIVFNNPSGPALAFRVGAYPAKSFADAGPRRRGLFVSLETRIGFMGGYDGTGYQIMGAVGYETF